MYTVYNFEAKSIQTYILDSSKLKDMVGASEQIEYLCHPEDGLLAIVLKGLDFQGTINIARQAGGAIQAIFSNEDDAKRFQAVWTFCVQKALPGLTFAQGMKTAGKLEDAIENTRKAWFKHNHNAFFPTLPLAGPLVARSPRTGQPAVLRIKLKEGSERLDATTAQKREFRHGTLLTDSLHFKTDRPIYWPINLDDKDQELDEKTFPLLPDNRYIAIVHADGNNFGQLIKEIQKKLLNKSDITAVEYAQTIRDFSKAIKDIAFDATKKAIIHIVVQGAQQRFEIMPARPLVLGGDDFTFIVRGDLALDFTQNFLKEFEEQSKTALADLKKKYRDLASLPDFPEQLTACAGIAYIKASQPFYQGYRLADSMCKQAKRFSKDNCDEKETVPSSLIFHRITTSIIDDYESILKYELRHDILKPKETKKISKTKSEAKADADGIQFTMQPYLVGNIKPKSVKYVHLDNLVALRQFLTKPQISQGTFREFLTLLEMSQEQAESAMQRWYDNTKNSGQENLLNELKVILEDLHIDQQSPNALTLTGFKTEIDKITYFRTPIGDALALISISKGSNYVPD
jgi:hypothetical protein